MAGAVMQDDIDELRHLLQEAKRPRVQSILSSQISSLEKTFKDEHEAAAAVEQTPKVIPLEIKKFQPIIQYTTLATFSWDQDYDKVKIYITLEGASQEKIEAKFHSDSVDLKIHDVGGKNYRCSVPKLNKSIIPEQSKMLVKPKRIIVTLKKADGGNWIDLHKKEEKFKAPAMDKDKDPMSGIMDLMKNMYDEGDDEMKKTIAKAWSDARTGKPVQPPKYGDL
jgi:calcyclin binding protein